MFLYVCFFISVILKPDRIYKKKDSLKSAYNLKREVTVLYKVFLLFQFIYMWWWMFFLSILVSFYSKIPPFSWSWKWKSCMLLYAEWIQWTYLLFVASRICPFYRSNIMTQVYSKSIQTILNYSHSFLRILTKDD